MSETYIKVILDKDARIQDCNSLLKELELRDVVKSVDVARDDKREVSNGTPVFFKPALKRWKKENLDTDELRKDLSNAREIMYESMDLMASLHGQLVQYNADDFDCLSMGMADEIMDEMKDIEITFAKVSEIMGKFREKLKGGWE